MSQEEIIKLLEEHPERWFTLSEISALLELDKSNVSNAIKSMIKFKEVEAEYREVVAKVKFKKDKGLSDII